MLDIQYRTQRHYFYELARNYFDEQMKDSTTFRRRTNRFEQCYQHLSDPFTTEQFSKTFGYANNRSASKTIDRLIKDKEQSGVSIGNAFKASVSQQLRKSLIDRNLKCTG